MSGREKNSDTRVLNPIYLQYYIYRSKINELINVVFKLAERFSIRTYVSYSKFMETIKELYLGKPDGNKKTEEASKVYSKGRDKKVSSEDEIYKIINDLRRFGIVSVFYRRNDYLVSVSLIVPLLKVSRKDAYFQLNSEVVNILSSSRLFNKFEHLFRMWVSYNPFVKSYLSVLSDYREIEVDYALKILIDVLEETYSNELAKVPDEIRKPEDLKKIEILKKQLESKTRFVRNFMKVMEMLSNNSIRLVDSSISVNRDKLMSILSEELLSPYIITYEALVRLYLNIIKKREMEHLLRRGVPVPISLRELYEEAIDSGIIPRCVDLKSFYKKVYEISLKYDRVKLFIHPLHASRPEEECQVIITLF